ncbi:MAG: UDP-N-acetylglucosamine 2-epimerase [Acidobacteriota bacterium]|nr:UDP-N-acetylglucosamine 2-epimerase [Acidobacteriota bacterium]
MRSIGVVTGARSDYGIYVPILRKICTDPELELRLFVTGMHLSEEHGMTVKVIESDGFPIAERVDIELSADTPEGIARSMGLGVVGFSQVYARKKPDLLLVLGDRFEILAAVAAALPFLIPVAHIAGGDLTEGAIDDAMRHAITKMSHLHFVTTEAARARVLQMGEESWRIHVTGDPGLDHIPALELLGREALEQLFGMKLEPSPMLVTLHPETLDYQRTSHHVQELLAALDSIKMPIVFTAPNADTAGREIREAIERFVASRANTRLVVNLGTQAYFSMMKLAAVMVGNSSSGIIEAASFALPVVNIGDRQRGRVHAQNVLHVPAERGAISAAIKQVLAPEFRKSLRGIRNPYGDGHAASRIVDVLKRAALDQLVHKKFSDLTALPVSRIDADGRSIVK